MSRSEHSRSKCVPPQSDIAVLLLVTILVKTEHARFKCRLLQYFTMYFTYAQKGGEVGQTVSVMEGRSGCLNARNAAGFTLVRPGSNLFPSSDA